MTNRIYLESNTSRAGTNSVKAGTAGAARLKPLFITFCSQFTFLTAQSSQDCEYIISHHRAGILTGHFPHVTRCSNGCKSLM